MTHLATWTTPMPAVASTTPPARSTGASAAPGRRVFTATRVRDGRATAAHGG